MMIDSQKVGEMVLESQWTTDLDNAEELPENALKVPGITGYYLFDKRKLESHRKQIIEWLNELPDEFHKDKGGGWSFLNACNTKDGVQWTDFHLRMEQLFAMAFGLELARFQLPREMWTMFPGGMPYIVVDTS